MISIEIIAIGKIRASSPIGQMCQEYVKRITCPLKIYELSDSKALKMREMIKYGAFVVALDEKGVSMASSKFAKIIESLPDKGKKCAQFLIGGADGHDDDVRTRADLLLSFGAQTWPHKMARAMLLEQIYRAQQILAGHPYHRD